MRVRRFIWKLLWEWRGKSKDELRAVGRPDITPFQQKKIIEDICIKLELNPQDILLDIGCAQGYVEKEIAEKVKQIYAVDFSKNSIEIAKDNLKSFANVTLDMCDALSVHDMFGNEQFTKILCYSVLYYLPDLDSVDIFFQNMAKMMKPDGILLIGGLCRKECQTGVNKEICLRGIFRLWLSLKRKVASSMHLELPFDELLAMADKAGFDARLVDLDKSLPYSNFQKDLIAIKR